MMASVSILDEYAKAMQNLVLYITNFGLTSCEHLDENFKKSKGHIIYSLEWENSIKT